MTESNDVGAVLAKASIEGEALRVVSERDESGLANRIPTPDL